jgi:CRISPR system Cascade subunit CasE
MIGLDTDTAILTKIIANPAHQRVRQDLRDFNRMHKTVTELVCPPDFGPQPRAAASLLYRAEETAAGVHLLVQSKIPVDATRLPAGYGYGGCHDMETYLTRLANGVPVRYRIVANPTKQEFVRGRRGTVRGLTEDDALEWWICKAALAGLKVTTAHITASNVLRGVRQAAGKRNEITLSTSRFDGTALVTDTTSVRTAILTGVGRAKSYGCGLLSLAPLA